MSDIARNKKIKRKERARKRLERRMGVRRGETFEVSLTSMIDMFTIILVFLLKSYSITDVALNPPKDVRLPESTASKTLTISVNVALSQEEILVEGKPVVHLQQGRVQKDDVQGLVIFPLYRELREIYNLKKEGEDVDPEAVFDRRVILQGDKLIPFSTLKKVLFTAGQAEFEAFRFAVIRRGSE